MKIRKMWVAAFATAVLVTAGMVTGSMAEEVESEEYEGYSGEDWTERYYEVGDDGFYTFNSLDEAISWGMDVGYIEKIPTVPAGYTLQDVRTSGEEYLFELVFGNEAGEEICIRIESNEEDTQENGRYYNDYTEIVLEAKKRGTKKYYFCSFASGSITYGITATEGLTSDEVNKIFSELAPYEWGERADTVPLTIEELSRKQSVNTVCEYYPTETERRLLEMESMEAVPRLYSWKTDGGYRAATVKITIYEGGNKKENARILEKIYLNNSGQVEQGMISVGRMWIYAGEDLDGYIVINYDGDVPAKSIMGDQYSLSSLWGEDCWENNMMTGTTVINDNPEEHSIGEGNEIVLDAGWADPKEDYLYYENPLEDIRKDPEEFFSDHAYGYVLTLEFE